MNSSSFPRPPQPRAASTTPHTRGFLKSQGLLAPWHEAIEIGRKSGIPVHLTHYRQSAQGAGSHLDYIGLVEDARAEGMDVTFDCYPYIYSSTRATIELPLWTMDGGPERIFEVISNPDDRARLVAEMKSGGRDATANWLTNLQKGAQQAIRGPIGEGDRAYAGPGPGGSLP